MLSCGDPTPYTVRIRPAGCRIICRVQTLAQAREAAVEFAKQRRSEGVALLETVTEGVRLRFRLVMMTSFAFILGLLPLVIAGGPSWLA